MWLITHSRHAAVEIKLALEMARKEAGRTLVKWGERDLQELSARDERAE
jgi:hypothetical protein